MLPRAIVNAVAGHIWSAGRYLSTPALVSPQYGCIDVLQHEGEWMLFLTEEIPLIKS